MAKKATGVNRKRVLELREQGMTMTAVGMEVGLSRHSVANIENGTFDLRLKLLAKRYPLQPLPLIDIITREGTATARDITDALSYTVHSDKYIKTLHTLKCLCEDKILKKTGQGGKGHPYKYAINQSHPQAYLIRAMCRPDDALDAMFNPATQKAASAHIE